MLYCFDCIYEYLMEFSKILLFIKIKRRTIKKNTEPQDRTGEALSDVVYVVLGAESGGPVGAVYQAVLLSCVFCLQSSIDIMSLL